MQQKLLHKATLQPAMLSEAISSRRWRCKPVHLASPSFLLLGLVHLGRSHHDWHKFRVLGVHDSIVSRTSRSHRRIIPQATIKASLALGVKDMTPTLASPSGSTLAASVAMAFLFFSKGLTGTGKCHLGWMYRTPEQNSLGQALCKLLCGGKTADEITLSFLKALCKPVLEAITVLSTNESEFVLPTRWKLEHSSTHKQEMHRK